MKILTISNCHLIESQRSGYTIVNFVRGLKQRGHEVDLFGPNEYEPLQFLQGRASRYRKALGIFFFCLVQINKKKYDIIEFYGAEAWLTVAFLQQFKKRPYLIICHSNGLETNVHKVMTQNNEAVSYGSKLKKWYQFDQTGLFEIFFNKVDGIITQSDYDRSYGLNQQYQQVDRLTTIEPGLLNTFLRLQLDFSRDAIIGYCGSWIPRKGTKIMINDVSNLLAEFPSLIFKLIGVGNDFKKEEYFPIQICNRISIIPFVENKDDLKKIYKTVSIFIMPSIYESFGLVSAEAMSCGCALVASKTGFAASLKHGEEAMLIDELISPHLYEAVKKLLLNESLRMKIAQNGYERVQNLLWNNAIDKLEITYLQWLDQYRINNLRET